jgi:hypothetical protein
MNKNSLRTNKNKIPQVKKCPESLLHNSFFIAPLLDLECVNILLSHTGLSINTNRYEWPMSSFLLLSVYSVLGAAINPCIQYLIKSHNSDIWQQYEWLSVAEMTALHLILGNTEFSMSPAVTSLRG